jgi:hypothetical protein
MRRRLPNIIRGEFFCCLDSLTQHIILRKFDMPEQGKALPIGLKFR